MQAKVTFYGYPDNDNGAGVFGTDVIAHARPGRHTNTAGEPVAGGVGTFDDPITAAVQADNTAYAVGAILYMPHLKKYLIVEDDCASCDDVAWVDVWLDSDASTAKDKVLACEGKWTGSTDVLHEVTIDPDPDLPVEPQPLFDKTTQTCNAS